MKISKEKLKQIINEEIELLEQEQSEEPEQALETRSQFAKKLKELSIELPKASRIDANEIKMINDIFAAILQKANADQAKQILNIINNFIDKKIK